MPKPLSHAHILMPTIHAVVVAALACTPVVSAAQEFCFTRERFDEMAEHIDRHRDLAKIDGGSIAWGEAYVLRGLLEMHQATQDREYLRRFVSLADVVLAVRDDALGRKDFAGRSLPLWGIADQYTVATATLQDEQKRDALAIRSIRYAYNNQTRVTIEPGTKPGTWRLSHSNEFGDAAGRYVSAAEESLATWESSWREGPNEGEGYYLLTPKGEPFWCDGIGAPLNYLGGAGQVLLYLHDVTGKQAYRDKAQRIARLFKNELELGDNGAYVWQYWWGAGEDGWTKADGLSDNTPAYAGGKYDEDLSHAAWEVEFAVQAHRRGIVFDEEDMKRLAATFTKNLWVPESNELADRVSGDRKYKGHHNIAGGRWVDLCEFDPQIFDIMRQIFTVHRYDKGAAFGHLAAVYARLYRRQEQLAK